MFETAGLSTVVLAAMRDVVERMHPPRALYCEFPLGRPLGKPGDPDFQRDVLMHALALLEAEAPVVADYPEVIVANEVPMACPVPALLDATHAPSEDEAQFLASSRNLNKASRQLGLANGLLPPKEASQYKVPLAVRQYIDSLAPSYVDGDPRQVRDKIQEIAGQYRADEVSLVTTCYSYKDRERSYRLVAQAFGITLPEVTPLTT